MTIRPPKQRALDRFATMEKINELLAAAGRPKLTVSEFARVRLQAREQGNNILMEVRLAKTDSRQETRQALLATFLVKDDGTVEVQ